MKIRLPRPLFATIASLLLATAFISSAKAGVIIFFEEVGGSVVATTSGSIQVPSVEPDSTSPSGSGFYGDILGLYLTGPVDVWRDGTFVESGLILPPNSAEGDTFGYYGDELDFASGVELGSTYTPDTTWTWSGETLESIGLGYLSGTPFQVYERDGQTISFAVAAPIPEPSVIALLMGAGVLAFVGVRRRFGHS